ncbi:DUF2102 domain-containing protein [Methanocella arvoryzae]|uniref:Uncharacterized protein n=1 Tax=Methanocella arvoryzae (strain DSM 22066 / NBRC 105507 / MRE50) TaxID=351160 RepID=Q0W5J1_METAR|nr:DUF2102 domain-containing protein [Methanocella arvoryzae]CAJ36352.1 hypothetical protein RCIX1021 [Methanocella arvoryzae MRE50]
MIVMDPEAGVRPATVICAGWLSHLPLRFKETCFGLLAEGDREIIRGFLSALRLAYPSGLIFRRRWYSIGDTAICRKTFAETRPLRRAADQIRHHCQS